ncbi:DUF3667 domain-containing protein [Hyphomonas johnsonii]|uniref:DUF3667 domain-containing protein n=1 Tax=Hyphomonas johnsonii MHS-2 TaxID=1280950 RepID=A0A059FEG8_9PROT|nr:DUF3667 domain-containing protein [Hyphomonas johnsonii]KCZ88918.1 hypothetical protein HJO_15414 [Hyphomonas johnsonii MHS-2]
MEHDIEAAGAASVSGLTSGSHHPVQSGLPCTNCGEVVPDRFCSTCGQLASDFHRPVWDLISGSLGDMFALDGRLLRSLPLLLFRPGRLTRNYLDGQRARYVPPFRMFLLASVIFFLTIFSLGDRMGWFGGLRFDQPSESGLEVGLTLPADRAARDALNQALADPGLDDATRAQLADSQVVIGSGIQMSEILLPDGKIDRVALRTLIEERADPDTTPAEIEVAYRTIDHAATVFENQDRFGARLRQWAPRFSLLFLPVFSLLLALLYAWHRQVYMYDHLITGLHFQTFLYVLGTALLIVVAAIPSTTGWAIGLGFALVLAYLYRLVRVTYGSGRLLSGLRAVLLLILSMILLAMLAIGLVVLSFFLT